MNVPDLMQEFAKEHKIFHSEADFQFKFAWFLKEKHKDAEIALEVPFKKDDLNPYDGIGFDDVCEGEGKRKNSRVELDILLEICGEKIGIELKYCLCDQKGSSKRHKDFRRDIKRLKLLKGNAKIDVGIAIFLTNDKDFFTSIFEYKKGGSRPRANYLEDGGMWEHFAHYNGSEFKFLICKE